MDRRVLITTGLAALSAASGALAQPTLRNPDPDRRGVPPGGPGGARSSFPVQEPSSSDLPPPSTGDGRVGSQVETYSRDELVNAVSDFLGVTAEAAGGMIERVFKDNGRPTSYIAGEEASAAIAVGLRYGRGLMYMKNQPRQEVFWQGPSVGWDVGGNGSRVFTLCYNLQYPDAIFRRFPGVEGTAYFVGGMGVNYQRADGITLAPVRAGVGLRLGANIGYLSYSRERHFFPF